MPGPTLTVDELGAELGRSPAWVYEHWRAEVAARRLPPPLNAGGTPYVWSRAQVYAVLDRGLTAAQRHAAAAHRAAYTAAVTTTPAAADAALGDAHWRDRLDRRFGGAP